MSLNGTVWAPAGPSPIVEGTAQDNGLVSSIAIHPYNPNVIYIGTAGGGVWRSRDGGLTWVPLFDRQLALGIGEPAALAIDPNNTDVVYAGTSQRIILGTGNAGFFGPPDSSQGLYKSTDGGGSWIQLGSGYPAQNTGNASQFLGQDINVVIVDPANSNVLYLAAFTPASGTGGVYFSSDGGQNWTAGQNLNGDVRSLVLDTSSPTGSRILYCGVTGQGVFRSADGGQHWAQILFPTTPAVGSGFGKVIVAIPPPTSTPNPGGVQVLYVTMQGTGANDPLGVFLSTNQGLTWAKQAATGMPTNTQGGYSFHMAVDPASPGDGVNDIIYFGTVRQGKSADSGATFTPLSVPHADTHAWAFIPQPAPTPSVVFCGNDGGIDKSVTGGVGAGAWTSLNAGGLQTALFFNIDLKPDATASVIVGAAQDNGLQTSAGAPVSAPLTWTGPGNTDGWDAAYDSGTPGLVYGTDGFWSYTPPPGPCTRMFVSTADGTNFPTGAFGAADITPFGTASDQACGVFPVAADPSNGGVVYVSGNQNLWQSQSAGAAGSWRKIGSFPGTGDVSVARANGNNVVIAVGTQVFLSTNALATSGVAFTNITRDLPGRNVPRAVFDPVDPTVIYAVVGGIAGTAGPGGHVFRTTIGGSKWTDISPTAGTPPQPLDLPFNAIALDGTDVPTTIYVGTDLGVLRSVDAGASWSVLDDLRFPRVPVTDLALNQTAGVLAAATYGRGVFKFVPPTGPAIAVNPQDGLAFGTVCTGPAYLTLQVFNVGGADLVIDSVQWLMGSTSFTVLGSPGTPLVIAPGDEVDFTVMYVPAPGAGQESATIRIVSNDPAAPVVDLTATGTAGTGAVAAAVVSGGDFGSVCVGSHADQLLTINNTGSCPLSVSDIISSGADFQAPDVQSYPLIVSPGGSIDVVIRFQPSSFGAKSGTITIFSDDPAGPTVLRVSGLCPAPRLHLMIANAGNFGKTCVGSFADEALILNNSGPCTLSITGLTSSSAEFIAPEALTYPIKIAPGTSLSVPIRFEPTSLGSTTAALTVTSDDPAGPLSINVSGQAPPGKLAVSGSTTFGGVNAGCCADRTLSICNVGECTLHVTSVHFKRKSHHWKLLHNPFPATLRPGSCLPVVLQYRATEKCSRSCELVIQSDDPETPDKIIDVLAYTIWDSHRREDCDDCRRGCCDKPHRGKSCRQGYPCCCEDDEDDEDRRDE
jgi:Abnormal spindle-like microcephaly-assoc'd, ASPM-SPD-2-Hydin